MAYNKADKLMIEFVAKSRDVLRRYDRLIYQNLKKSRHKGFFEDEWKGLGAFAITEPIVRFLISVELCRTYRIWPERQYDDGSRCRADLTVYLDESRYKRELPPDIAIELKWGDVRKKDQPGSLSQWSLDVLETDLRKLRDHSKSPHRYVLQVAFAPKSVSIDKDELQKQIREEISGHITGFYNVRLLTAEYFNTHGSDAEKMDHSCWLICWKIS